MDMIAEISCKALINGWIAHFECPITIITDQSHNFESHLFDHLTELLGVNRIHTTSYHLHLNSIIRRFHRHLKGNKLRKMCIY